MTAEATSTPGPITLSEALAQAPDGQVPAPGLEVWCDGERWELIGTGERAATLAPPGGGWEGRVRRRHELAHVDPAAVRWVPAEPTPKEAFARLQNLNRETKAARAAYNAERDGSMASQAGRASAGRRPAATLGDQVCSRPDCDTVLHPANKTGVCRRCQLVCPECGGPKSQVATACAKCGSKGGRRPGSVSVVERACAACGAPMGVATKADTCLACRRRCACGRPKSEEAERCGVCAPAARRAASAASRALLSPPGRAEMPLADVVPLPQPNAVTTSATAILPPSASLALEELPDYVGSLLAQIDRLSGRVQELEREGESLRREVERLRGREDAWRDVERRVQAVIAGARRGRRA